MNDKNSAKFISDSCFFTMSSYCCISILLRQFGFQMYAIDMIKAPSVIKRYLVKNYGMHNIPIGGKEVMNHVNSLPENLGFFFSGMLNKINTLYLEILLTNPWL